MSVGDSFLVDSIRAASRKMVRELGFMQPTLAATPYPPSAVHAILEIGAQSALTAAQLADLLSLEKSSISRMVRKLVEAGELKEAVSNDDGRAKQLTLTAQGRRTLTAIHKFGRRQVSTALAQMTLAQQKVVGQGMDAYAQALEAHRLGQPAIAPVKQFQIKSGYRPGVIGRVTEMHASFYTRNAGFGQFFESQVAAGMAEFVPRLENRCNEIWLALHEDRIAGAIAIDGEDLKNNSAHLRWFIVDESLRGAGAGHALLKAAVAFCDRQRFASIQLWTFQGLDAARALYESFGFSLVEERPGSQWGKEVIEQRFVR